ncbi:MAG: TonB-dependent receptor, partial [Polyangiales bacterium]
VVRICVFLMSGLACFAPGVAGAQYGATAQVKREIPSGNALDPTAAGTDIVVRDRYVEQSLRDLLQLSTGTRIVQFGAAGSPFCLRIRGAPCDQSTVLLGDLPLSNPDSGSFDLSLVPIEAIREIQVYRGGAPSWLNQGAIGGVLRLMPREYEKNTAGARVTGGSFGSWRANGFGAYAGDKVQFFATGGGAGAENDFPYIDDNATRFDPSDDVERRRMNADFLEGFGFSRMVADTSDKSEISLTFLGLGRDRGEPGPGSRPALQARSRMTRLLGSAAWTQQDKGAHPYRLQVLTSYDYGRNRFEDPLAEIGIFGPEFTDDRNHSLFGRLAADVEIVPWLTLTTIGSARYFVRDLSVAPPADSEDPSDRITVSGTVETKFHWQIGDVAFELRPSVLLTWTRAAIETTDLGPEPDGSDDFLPTFRVGAAIAPLAWLGLRGSVSSGFRLPTVTELFGNRSTIVGNARLVPEQAVTYDAAITVRGRSGIAHGYASVGFFRRNVEDEIRFFRTSQFTLVPQNIDEGRNTGIEAELVGDITEHFSIWGEVTWVQARDRSTGNQIPGQPELVATVRPTASSGELSSQVSDLLLFVELDHIGKSYSDPANLITIPARTTIAIGAGILLFKRALGLGFRAEDVFDIRGEDFVGFPLPGRQFSGRVSYAHAW